MASTHKNIFVAYTPYHVLLACCIAMSDNKDEQNYLLIVSNFSDADILCKALKNWKDSPFLSIELFLGEYGIDQMPKWKARFLRYFTVRSICSKIGKFINTLNINRIYLFNEDRPQSLYLLNLVKLSKGLCRAIFVEDGAVTYNSYIEKKNWIYLFLGKIIYGYWWKNVEVMGSSPFFDSIKAVFPDFVRPELSQKKVEKIYVESFLNGNTNDFVYKYLENYGLTLDKLNSFDGMILLSNSRIINQFPEYRKMIEKVIDLAQSKNLKVAVKYHPRDANVDHFELASKGVDVLNSSVPIELIYLAVRGKFKFVIADFSTTLLSAVWMLDETLVISMGKILGGKDVRFISMLDQLGVALPEESENVEVLLRNSLRTN
jgi:Alpha-2,8-polysialyltransferase (POLYST)